MREWWEEGNLGPNTPNNIPPSISNPQIAM